MNERIKIFQRKQGFNKVRDKGTTVISQSPINQKPSNSFNKKTKLEKGNTIIAIKFTYCLLTYSH